MAKFQLSSDETLVGSGLMSHKQKWGLSSQMYQGTIYVTNRRICFHMSMSGTVLMDVALSESQRVLYWPDTVRIGSNNLQPCW